jgi:hypothetical protein
LSVFSFPHSQAQAWEGQLFPVFCSFFNCFLFSIFLFSVFMFSAVKHLVCFVYFVGIALCAAGQQKKVLYSAKLCVTPWLNNSFFFCEIREIRG